MITIVTLLWLLICTNTQWIAPTSPVMPRELGYMALGYYNNVIYILGGWTETQQMTEYNIIHNNFTDHGVDATSSFIIYGESQYFTQINNYLYTIDVDGYNFRRYNLETNIFDVDFNNQNIPNGVDPYGCLASSESNNGTFLFVVGGSSTGMTNLNIYITSDDSWILSPPTMNIIRTSLSCIVHPLTNKLYAIGGYKSSVPRYIDTVEYIDITDIDTISSQSWIYLNDTLEVAISEASSVIYNEYIYVIGGFNDGGVRNEVQTINTFNGNIVTVSYLDYSVCCMPSLIVNNIIYTFGGYVSTGFTDRFQYYAIPTPQPTTNPSPNPSISPSKNPSMHPSVIPSSIPSMIPSSIPSMIPSDNPSTVPSISPTSISSMYPSVNPSKNPSGVPSIFPSASGLENNSSMSPSNKPNITITRTNDALNNENDIIFEEFVYIIIAIIVCICCFCVISLICICRYRKRRELNINKKNMGANMTRIISQTQNNSNSIQRPRIELQDASLKHKPKHKKKRSVSDVTLNHIISHNINSNNINNNQIIQIEEGLPSKHTDTKHITKGGDDIDTYDAMDVDYDDVGTDGTATDGLDTDSSDNDIIVDVNQNITRGNIKADEFIIEDDDKNNILTPG